MRVWVAAALVVLAGCSDPVGDAERELEIIESTGGSSEDLCRAKRKVAEAHLRAQDAEAYERARVHADVACQHAELERLYGPAPTT